MFDVSLDLYKIFCTVVKTGNMSLAANELFISQPAVSMAILKLENTLGHPLLVRSSKGIKTTAEGGVLYEYLNQALNLIETAEAKYTEMTCLQSGEIKIGASDTLTSHFLLRYFEKYYSLYPQISIKVTNRTTSETIKLLKNGQIDIGFVNLPIGNDYGIEVAECLEISDALISGTRFRHLADKGISAKELSDYPLLLLERESNTRLYIDKFFQEYGIIINPYVELGSHELLIKFAKINFGLAFVIKEFTEYEIDNVSVFEVPLIPAIPRRHVGLIKLKNVALSYAANKFTELF